MSENMHALLSFHNDFDCQKYLIQPNIYHYTDRKGIESILKNKQLRFTNRSFLNDESEGRYVLQLLKKRIDEILPVISNEEKQSQIKVAIIEEIENMLDKMDRDPEGVYQVSFSTKQDSLCMWNYYADDGYCIHFDKECLINSFKKLVCPQIEKERIDKVLVSGQVIYDVEQQMQILKDIMVDFFDLCKDKDIIESGTTYCLIQTVLKMGVFFKHPAFKIEDEYRIAVPLWRSPKDSLQATLVSPKENTYYRIETENSKPHVDLDFDAKAIQKIGISPVLRKKQKEIIAVELWLKKYGYDTEAIQLCESKIPLVKR